MSKATHHQVISENIFTNAGHLIGKDNYTEKKSTTSYINCNRLFVDHKNKAFWFTTQKHIQHTKKLSHV